MTYLLEQLIAKAWNRVAAGPVRRACPGALTLGHQFVEGRVTQTPVALAQLKRAEHIAILGKTGSGKSSAIRNLVQQDIKRLQGFCVIDQHGDATPAYLSYIAQAEQRLGRDFSDRLILVEPADREYSVGLNFLEGAAGQQGYVQIAEFTQILRQRWHLDSFGPRTEELLRNCLLLLAERGLTIVEIVPLLTDATFRATVVGRCTNAELASYFRERFDRHGEAMQNVVRDALLNKVTEFTGDPHFRHLLGQRHSTFSIADALDQGNWILVNLDKGRLGEHGGTVGSLLLAKIKSALFSRRGRALFSLYCDEIQNLAHMDSSLETLFSEARKFGIGVTTANQYLEQHPAPMRAAILSVGSHILFQLSSADADRMAAALDGGKHLAEILKNLPQRHMVVKSGHRRWVRAVVPEVHTPRMDPSDLVERCRRRWARRRTEIETEIRRRTETTPARQQGALDGWD